jgi:arsenate reductase (thioredoxin)
VSKPSVLVVCTGNSARSQMAEGFMTKYLSDDFSITSAGLDPKPVIHPLAIEVMREAGIDISQQYPKALKSFLGQYFTFLITVCSNAGERCPIFPGVSYRLFWPFEDPAAFEGTEAEKIEKFRQIRDQIDNRIREWMLEWMLEYKLKQVYPGVKAV